MNSMKNIPWKRACRKNEGWWFSILSCKIRSIYDKNLYRNTSVCIISLRYIIKMYNENRILSK